MESADSSSTSDEEYIPPTKASRQPASDSESSSESSVGEDDECNGKTKSKGLEKDASGSVNVVDNKTRDDIWNDFLSSVETPLPTKTCANQPVDVVRKYQFAGTEVEVTERICPTPKTSEQSTFSKPYIQNSSSFLPSPTKTVTNKASSTVAPLVSKPASSLKRNLASALQNLKSVTGEQAPKLSTLEKSRLDWKSFIRKEDIEDDLRAHNKGKQGYLERQAFVDRASEREYSYQNSLLKRKK